MSTNSFTVGLKQRLSPETWQFVYLALRHDATLWDSLENTDLGQKALDRHQDYLEAWSPAALALLAIDLPVSLNDLTQMPLQALPAPYQEKALRLYKKHAAQITLGVQSLSEAGWLALALRERRIYLGSWKGLSSELVNHQAGAPTILACLFSMVPDGREMLGEICLPGLSEPQPELALHTLLANPMPTERLLEHLKSFTERLPIDQTSVFLKQLSFQRPDLAARCVIDGALKTTGLGPANHHRKAIAYPDHDQLLDSLGNVILECGIYHDAGVYKNEIPLLQQALSLTRRIYAQVSAGLAQTLAKRSAPTMGESLATEQEAWRMAIQFDPDHPIYRAGLAASLVKDGKLEEAGEILKPLPDQPQLENAHTTTHHHSHPALLIASAQLAARQGQSHLTKHYALRALEHDLCQPSLEPFLPDFCQLLLNLDMPQEADQATSMALRQQPNRPDLLTLQAHTRAKVNKFGDALSSAFQAYALQPENSEIHQLLIENLELAEEWEAAFAERQHSLSLSSSVEPGDLHALANCAIHAGQLAAAQEACRQALEKNPEDGTAYELLGSVSQAMNDPATAFARFQKATELAPQRPLPWIALAQEYRRQNQNTKAIQLLRIASQAAPESADIQLALGEAYLSENAPTQALVALRRAGQFPQARSTQSRLNDRIALHLGRTLYQLGHFEEARQVYEAALHTDQPDSYLSHGYAQTLLALGEVQPALALLDTVLQTQPDNPQVILDYARAALEHTDNSQAIHRAVHLLKSLLASVDQEDTQSRREKKTAACLFQPEEIEKAQAYLAEALSKIGENDEAARAYRQAMDSTLATAPAWKARLLQGYGNVALALTQYDTAIAALQEAEQLEPQNTKVLQKLAEAYLGAGLAKEALQSATNVLKSNSIELPVLTWFAEQCLKIFDKNGDNSARIKAFQALERATELAPERGDLWVDLAARQLQYGEQEAASQTLDKLVALATGVDPDYPNEPFHPGGGLKASIDDYWQGAQCLNRLGKYDQAALLLDQAIQEFSSKNIPPDEQQPLPTLAEIKDQSSVSLDFLVELARNYLQAGNFSSALATIECAIPLAPNYADLYQLKADTLVGMENVQAAITSLQAALRLQPNEIRYHWQMIQLCYANNDLPGGITHADNIFQLAGANPETGSKTLENLLPSPEYLAAEICRALLQFEQATAYLQRHSSTLKDTLDCVCLQAELALDAGDDTQASELITRAVQSDSGNPKVLALQTWLAARSVGLTDQAMETYQAALEVYSQNIEYQPAIGIQVPGSLAGLRILAKAALGVNLWEDGLAALSKIVELAPQEPAAHLQYIQALTTRAEEQRLCQALDILHQAPGTAALDSPARMAFMQAVEALQAWAGRPDITQHWQARGLVAFDPTAANVASFKANLDSSKTPSAEDLSAWLFGLSYAGCSSGETTPEILNAAQSLPATPAVWLALCVALRDSHPNQAYQYLQLVKSGLESRLQTPKVAYLQAYLSEKIASNGSSTASTEPSPVEWPGAIQAIESALAAWPEEARWHARAAEIYINATGPTISSDTGEKTLEYRKIAQTHLQEAIRLEPNQISHAIRLSEVLVENNQSEYAREVLDQSAQLNPDQATIWMALARLELQAGNLDQAAIHAERAVELAASQVKSEITAEALVLRGEIALQSNNLRGAQSRARAALQFQPDHPKALHLCAQALDGMGEPEEALKILDKAIQFTNDPYQFKCEKVQLVRKAHGLSDGLAAIQGLINEYPTDNQLLACQAEWLLESDQPDQAYQSAQQALKLPGGQLMPPQRAKLHLLIGRQCRSMGQLDRAIHHLNEVINLDPTALEAYIELGRTHQDRRQINQALKIYQKAINAIPNNYRPYQEAGLLLKDCKDYPEAESMLRRAAQLAPHEINLHRQLGAVVALNLVHNGRLSHTDRSGD